MQRVLGRGISFICCYYNSELKILRLELITNEVSNYDFVRYDKSEMQIQWDE